VSDIRNWSGTLAFLNRRTEDGRMLVMPELATRELPIPLTMVGAVAWHDEFVGAVESVGRDGDTITGSGTIDLDAARLLNPELAERLLAGGRVGVGIALFGTTTKEAIVRGAPDALTGQVFTEGTLVGLHIHDNQAWPDAVITLDPES
jgi:hypothetical protein